ncbi:hypothetical protein HZB00_00295 [Candidatus Woesearchaeota archaeon]|nr:hypothetical protein [Candidatus Woesearchaeota archaeon]
MKKWFGLLLISLIFITACSPGQIDFSNFPSFFSGTTAVSTGKGIVLEWTEYPKKDIQEGSEFSLGLRVKNFAKIPVEGNVCVRDALPSQSYGGIPEDSSACRPFHLEKAQTFESKVQPDIFESDLFGPFRYQNLQPTSYAPGIAAEVEYRIESMHTSRFCVKNPNSREKLPADVKCDVSETGSVVQDDLPLMIKKITKDVNQIAGNRVSISFDINVNQQEDGTLRNYNAVSQGETTRYPQIDFAINYLGIPFACNPLKDGKIEVRETENSIRCTSEYTFNSIDPYQQDQLVLTLKYRFRKISRIPSNIGLIPLENKNTLRKT